MAKKRGLSRKRGLDALLGSSKVGREVSGVIKDAHSVLTEQQSSEPLPQTGLSSVVDHRSDVSVSDVAADQAGDMGKEQSKTADANHANKHNHTITSTDKKPSTEKIDEQADKQTDAWQSDEKNLTAVMPLSTPQMANDEPTNLTEIKRVSDGLGFDDVGGTDDVDSDGCPSMQALLEYQKRQIALFWQFGLQDE